VRRAAGSERVLIPGVSPAYPVWLKERKEKGGGELMKVEERMKTISHAQYGRPL